MKLDVELMSRLKFDQCFQISKSRIEYMECKFNKNRNKEEAIRLDGQEISKSESFQYLDQ